MKKSIITIIQVLFIAIALNAQTISYDALGRITTMVYADGTNVSYTYDGVGNRKTKVVTNAPLPVEWLSFTARGETEGYNHSILEWATATEKNCSHYVIQHSTDGVTFSSIGEERGAGTTTERQDYDFIHDEPVIGVNYYRLKQVDFDGKYEYSNVVSVKFEMELPKLSMQLFPNPTSGILNIQIGKVIETPTFQVFDIQGRLITVNMNNSSGNQWSFNTADLPNGHYFLQMKQGEQILNKKFVVSK